MTGIRCFLAMLLAIAGGIDGAFAEDIDLFTGINPSGGNPPTVLLAWHSSGNANSSVVHGCTYDDVADKDSTAAQPGLGDTVGGMEQCALVNTLLSLKSEASLLGKINVGLMMFNETGFDGFDNGTELGNGNNTCGFLVSPPVLMDNTGIDTFVTRLKTITNNHLANQSRLGDMVAEAWSMLNGLDYSCSGVDYSSLAEVATECQDAVVIYIGNATKETATVSDGTGDPESLLKSELTSKFGYSTGSSQYQFFTDPMAVTSLNNSDSATNKFWGDEWTQFIHRVNTDDRDDGQQVRNIATYAIAVYDPALQAKLAGEINFYTNLANKGGGKSFLVEYDQHGALRNVLIQIFNEVQAVNSVFASAALPVNANIQGQFLNQVFIAMFRPDGSAQPRWYGNLKQYQLGFDAGGNIVLTDSTVSDPGTQVAHSVTNPVTGTVTSSAVSFWTTNSPSGVTGWPDSDGNGTADGFWRNSPKGDGFANDSPDGDLVEKGGAAQMLRVDNFDATYTGTPIDENSRNLYTCNNLSLAGCTAGNAMPEFKLSNSSLDTSLFGVSSSGVISGLSLTVGKGTVAGTMTCVGGNTKECTVAYTGTLSSDIAVGDRFANTVASVRCPVSSPCTVSAVNATASPKTFTFKYSGQQPDDNCSGVSTCTTNYTIGSTTANVTAPSAHGFAFGDTALLSDCSPSFADSNTGPVFGLDDSGGLPGIGSTRGVSIASVPSSTTFTFTLSTGSFAPASTGITCSITTNLDASTLVKWIRGEDNAGNEVDAGPCDGTACTTDVTIRPSVHGDVLHSRPAVINYGGSTGVVVFYGSNDGVFHAINGNQSASISGVRPGGELWGFVAPEFFSKFKRLYQNTPAVQLEHTVDPTAQPRDYFFDGSSAVLQDKRTVAPASTKDKVIIYLTARRGGRLLYALDVTDPLAPKYLWAFSNSNIAELGYTWSQPKVALLEGYTETVTVGAESVTVGKPVLILGAGYDPTTQDADPVTASGDTMGRGILILDAATGEVVWAALPSCSGITTVSGGACVAETGLTRSIAADVTLIDRNFDGFVDRLYAADVGGNIWRVDLGTPYVAGTAPGNWDIDKLAALGGSGNDARKFLFPPDVVPVGGFDLVMAVSGDREHPLYTDSATAGKAYNVQDRFFLLQDDGTHTKPTDADQSAPITVSDLFEADGQGTCTNTTDNTSQACNFSQINLPKKGYFFDLPNQGEKGVNAPLAVAGKVFFGTNQPDIPSEGSCTANLGIARAYSIDFRTGNVSSQIFAGGGLPPSPIAGLVTIGGQTVPFIIGGTGPSPFDPGIPPIDVSGKRNRAYWYFK